MGNALRRRWGWSVLPGLLAVAVAARADPLWRCVGVRGETVFSSSRSGYSHCRRMPMQSVQALHDAAQGRVRAATPVVPTLDARQVTTLPRIRRNARVLRGTVYKVTLADGAVEYTNVAPAGVRVQRVDALFTYISTCYACALHSGIDWHTVPLRLHAYAREIDVAAARYGLDPALLRAVIHAESAFNPYAISDKGARGLMQLMPQTASEMGVSDVFDPSQNIAGGARYLAELLRDFGGNTTLATAAYNAGAAAVRKYDNRVPPYDETRTYVRRVAILAQRYARAERGTPLARSG